jgi:mannosyltransferase
MIIYDGIIYSWHGAGGIAVYYEEISSRLNDFGTNYIAYRFIETELPITSEFIKPRLLERYRSFTNKTTGQIFHSTYYRLPTDRSLKIVTTVHDFTYEKYVRGLRGLIHSTQKVQAIRGSDIVICVSMNTADDLFHYVPDFPKSKVIVVLNGASDDYVPLDKSPLTVSEKPYVLFVGMRSRYKNFAAAVDAIRANPDLILRCVGGGEFLKDEINFLEQKLRGRYCHAGRVTNTKLNELYNGAYCLIYPSLYEGFGIPLVEAMKAGCPVLAYNASSVPEIIGSSGCLVAQPDAESFNIGLNRLKDRSYRNDLIASGLERATNFSWRKTAAATAEIYSRAANL